MEKLRQSLRTACLSLLLCQGFASVSAQDPQGNLPIVYVTTEGGAVVVDKEDKVAADIWIDPCRSGMDGLGSQESPVAFTLSGRGNYTWTGFEKKPYKIKFSSKTGVLGMPKNKTFALLAHADDNLAFLRNTMGFELSRRMGLEWTPTQIPVEYVFNGQYQGIYFLSETIKVDKNRVNITEQEDLETDPANIEGGWLVEIDNYDTDPHLDVVDPAGHRIFFTYKSPEELSAQQEEYLQMQLEALTAAIYEKDKLSDKWQELIDIESAARYYVVQEILDDCESYHGSCYIYKDRGAESKWKFGPVWDFGNTYQRETKSWIWDRPLFYQVWIGELYKFPAFQEKVKEVWREFMKEGYPGLIEYIDNFIDNIEDANARSASRWPQYHQMSLREGEAKFKSMMANSIAWLSDKWDIHYETIYLRGDLNNWTLEHPMTTEDGNFYSINLDALSGTFKLATEDWDTIDLGANKNEDPVEVNTPYILSRRGANMRLATESVGPCTIELDLEKNEMTVKDSESRVIAISSERISIEGRSIHGKGKINVFDLTGRKIAEGDGVVTLRAPGLYIITAEDCCRKVIIK